MVSADRTTRKLRNNRFGPRGLMSRGLRPCQSKTTREPSPKSRLLRRQPCLPISPTSRKTPAPSCNRRLILWRPLTRLRARRLLPPSQKSRGNLLRQRAGTVRACCSVTIIGWPDLPLELRSASQNRVIPYPVELLYHAFRRLDAERAAAPPVADQSIAEALASLAVRLRLRPTVQRHASGDGEAWRATASLTQRPAKLSPSFETERSFVGDREGEIIATALGAYLYDLKGNLVGYLHGEYVIDPRTQLMPIAYRNLLEGKPLGS
jgi:hypothetical protein